MPADFIPIAEESAGSSSWPLGPGRACRQVGHSRIDHRRDRLRVAINIPAAPATGNLVEDVRNALEISGLEPGSLVIELTESTIMQNTEVNLGAVPRAEGRSASGSPSDDFRHGLLVPVLPGTGSHRHHEDRPGVSSAA